MVKTVLSQPRTQVQFLVWELRSHELYIVAKKIKKTVLSLVYERRGTSKEESILP